jgi:CPA2 family monovalent cation:H+ antiporter-2
MSTPAHLRDIVIFLATVAVFTPIFHRFRVSPVLAFLISGVVVGPHGLGLIGDIEGAARLGEFGVVFLLFVIGLELSVDRLYVLRAWAFGLGTAQVLVTGAALGGIAYGFLGSSRLALIIGLTLALSSTAVVLRLLSDRHEMSTGFGRASLAVLLFQDLAVVPLLVLIPLLGNGSDSVVKPVGLALVKAVAALVVIILIGRFLFRPLLRVVAGTRLKEAFAAITLLAVLGTAWATELAGLSLALGAFLAGVVIAETEYRHQIEADIQPVHGLLLGLFFMSVGMTLDVPFAVRNLGLVLGLTAVLMLVKLAIATGLGRAFGQTSREAIRTGFMLSQAGEFGFILLALAATHAGLPQDTAQLLKVVVALTMAATPFMAILGQRAARLVESQSADAITALTHEIGPIRDHVIIGGFGRVGQTVAKLLSAKQIPFVALDLDTARIKEGRDAGYRVYYGESGQPHVMRAAGAASARAVVVTLDHPQRAARTVAMLRREFPDVPVIVRARDNRHRDELMRAGATMIIPEMLEGSLSLGRSVLRTVGVSDDETEAIVNDFRRADYAGLDEIIGPGAPNASSPRSDNREAGP